MKTTSHQITVIAASILFIALLYSLAPILTPFLLGGLLAYLVDPLVKHLQKWHIPHLLSVILIFIFLFLTVILLTVLLYPLIYKQIESLINLLPEIINWIQKTGMPWLLQFVDFSTLKNSLPTTLSKTGLVLSSFIHSSVSVIVTLVLTPIVTFYLLRDWDKVLNGIKNLLPKKSAPEILQLAKDCDEVLGAFIRGQLLVMLCLSIIYGVGLSIIGLRFGLIIGLVGGLLSIVPYLGSLFVIVASIISAIAQDGNLQSIIYVLIVYLIGQIIEGYVLTPYLVGERIGLHPVAVIFAIMAGGTLFGFFGVLLALPVSAILMATFRFFRKREHA